MIKKAAIKSIREAFEEAKGHTLKLTDQAVSDIVEKCEGWDTMDGDAQLALFEKAEEAFKGIAVSDPGITGLANKIDPEFTAELVLCLEAGIKAKTSGVDMYGQFKRVYKKALMDAMPYPGSDKDDVVGTNYAPDIVERKAVAGGMIRTVWLDDYVQAHPLGKTYQADMDDCTKELAVSGSIARFKNKSKQWLRDTYNQAKQGRDGMRKLFRIAIQLHHKLSAIEGMPLVKLEWIPTAADKCSLVPKEYTGTALVKVTRSPKPFWIKAIDAEGNEVPNSGKEFSVAQIIAFNPAKALKGEGGGTMGDLIDSAKGEPETPESMGEKMTVEQMDTFAVVLWNKLKKTDERAALRARALEAGNEDLRETYCALAQVFNAFYRANEKWYTARLEAQEAQTEEQKKLAATG